MLSVLIVDDHASVRSMARTALAHQFVVVGEAADGDAALRLARELRPDVVLLDVHLPDMDGFAVAAALARDDDPPVMVMTSSRDRSEFEASLRESSVRAFIPKERLSASALADALT
jgi:two-component system nitrate/nitrite response regulator NarL